MSSGRSTTRSGSIRATHTYIPLPLTHTHTRTCSHSSYTCTTRIHASLGEETSTPSAGHFNGCAQVVRRCALWSSPEVVTWWIYRYTGETTDGKEKKLKLKKTNKSPRPCFRAAPSSVCWTERARAVLFLVFALLAFLLSLQLTEVPSWDHFDLCGIMRYVQKTSTRCLSVLRRRFYRNYGN